MPVDCESQAIFDAFGAMVQSGGYWIVVACQDVIHDEPARHLRGLCRIELTARIANIKHVRFCFADAGDPRGTPEISMRAILLPRGLVLMPEDIIEWAMRWKAAIEPYYFDPCAEPAFLYQPTSRAHQLLRGLNAKTPTIPPDMTRAKILC